MSMLETLYHSRLGKALAPRVGLRPAPVLRRGRTMPSGPVVLAELAGAVVQPSAGVASFGIVAEALALLGVPVGGAVLDLPSLRTTDEQGRAQAPRYPDRPGALVVDATRLTSLAELELLRQVLRPVVRDLEGSGRVVIVARAPESVDGQEAVAVAHALDGINRTLAKELRGGSTSNLLWLRSGTQAGDLTSTLLFLLEGRSAFVSGQTIRVGPAKHAAPRSDLAQSVLAQSELAQSELAQSELAHYDRAQYDRARPHQGRVVVVTGAARGIGAAIARTFARDGAHVVCVDVPAAGESLAAVANEVRGTALQLDITSESAGRRIAQHVATVHGAGARTWAVVHNAGILRDKLLVNLDEVKWAQVLEVNLAAQMRINEVMLDPSLPGGLDEPGRLIGIASTSGIAGNKGQANYAASKAGVVGLVRALSEDLASRPITVNAVAPGFIETEMTASIPFVQREVFRRSNSLSQGGQPVDVAETIAWLCEPGSGGLDAQVVRVCGQNLVGA